MTVPITSTPAYEAFSSQALSWLALLARVVRQLSWDRVAVHENSFIIALCGKALVSFTFFILPTFKYKRLYFLKFNV